MSQAPTHEEISARAHQLYIKGGCLPGREVENWLQAETELIRERQTETAPVVSAIEPAEAPVKAAPKPPAKPAVKARESSEAPARRSIKPQPKTKLPPSRRR